MSGTHGISVSQETKSQSPLPAHITQPPDRDRNNSPRTCGWQCPRARASSSTPSRARTAPPHCPSWRPGTRTRCKASWKGGGAARRRALGACWRAGRVWVCQLSLPERERGTEVNWQLGPRGKQQQHLSPPPEQSHIHSTTRCDTYGATRSTVPSTGCSCRRLRRDGAGASGVDSAGAVDADPDADADDDDAAAAAIMVTVLGAVLLLRLSMVVEWWVYCGRCRWRKSRTKMDKPGWGGGARRPWETLASEPTLSLLPRCHRHSLHLQHVCRVLAWTKHGQNVEHMHHVKRPTLLAPKHHPNSTRGTDHHTYHRAAAFTLAASPEDPIVGRLSALAIVTSSQRHATVDKDLIFC